MNVTTFALIALWGVVLVLGVALLATIRQVGVLFERVAPMGALMTDAGPAVNTVAPRFNIPALDGSEIAIGGPRQRAQLIFFLSPSCPVCKKLLPILRSVRHAEESWLEIIFASDGVQTEHEAFVASTNLSSFPYVLSTELGMSYRVSRLPYGVVIDAAGVIRAKGLVNNREQLESLFNAHDLKVPSIQGYLQATPALAS